MLTYAEGVLAILEVHTKLEGQAAGLAARQLSRDNAARLEATVTACEAHARDKGDAEPYTYYALNVAFYGIVAESADNPFLEAMIKTNGRKLMAYYRARFSYAGVIVASAPEHRALADLIVTKKAEDAEAAMAAYVHFDPFTPIDLLAALV